MSIPLCGDEHMKNRNVQQLTIQEINSFHSLRRNRDSNKVFSLVNNNIDDGRVISLKITV